MDNIKTTCILAFKIQKPIVIMYDGSNGITQRKIFVRKITEKGVLAYCVQKKAVRMFKMENIFKTVDIPFLTSLLH